MWVCVLLGSCQSLAPRPLLFDIWLGSYSLFLCTAALRGCVLLGAFTAYYRLLSLYRSIFIVSAKRLMEEARDSEAAVMAALKKAKMAFDNANIAKTTGENVVKNITVLIKVKKIDVSAICQVTQNLHEPV